MMTSIAYRMTGAAFYFGTLILTWWLIAVASGPKSYHAFETYPVSPPGKFVLLLLMGADPSFATAAFRLGFRTRP
jgi:succinate dehydrogenase / fumarate reductase cytochrome b subunit